MGTRVIAPVFAGVPSVSKELEIFAFNKILPDASWAMSAWQASRPAFHIWP